jgi:hypothetical protein
MKNYAIMDDYVVRKTYSSPCCYKFSPLPPPIVLCRIYTRGPREMVS